MLTSRVVRSASIRILAEWSDPLRRQQRSIPSLGRADRVDHLVYISRLTTKLPTKLASKITSKLTYNLPSVKDIDEY
jgi:hypothetical protein